MLFSFDAVLMSIIVVVTIQTVRKPLTKLRACNPPLLTACPLDGCDRKGIWQKMVGMMEVERLTIQVS